MTLRGWPLILALVILPAGSSLAALRFLGPHLLGLEGLRAEVASRPPIAVMDIEKAIYSNIHGDATDPTAVLQARERVKTAARRLREAGYIVLDAQNVYAYPPDFEASP